MARSGSVLSSLGLDELFSMVVRRNPRRVSVETYERRFAEKGYSKRRSGVRIVQERPALSFASWLVAAG